MNEPKWLLVMRAITGLTETPGDADNPKIMAMNEYIAQCYPEMRAYCDGYTHDSIAWCGLTEAFCMAVAGIRPPFGPTDTDRWLWARAWAEWVAWGQELSRPQVGCIVVMEREGGGHVTTFEYEKNGMLYCRGGNQSDAVNLQGFDPDTTLGFFWPREAGDVPQIPVEDRPMLENGDTGPDVYDLQGMLNKQGRAGLDVDGEFGPATEQAVLNYQKSRQLEVDGVVGPQTWQALYDKKPPVIPKPPTTGYMPPQMVRGVCDIAINSEIADYIWQHDRGPAPAGYTKGVAVAFANTYRQWKAGYGPALEMAQRSSGNSDKDVLAWYAPEYRAVGMDNSSDGAVTLRHLWALVLGLGMMESSGEYCCGRDQSASNTSSDTCEAGAWQTSYNAHNCSDMFDRLFDDYEAHRIQGFQQIFEEDVSCSDADWQNYGSGKGLQFQMMCKEMPAFAAQTNAITLRNLRNHYGPINRKEAELRREADEMLQDVMEFIDEMEDVIEGTA
jgi:uncharacterized protein (TIGR02594 family)